MIQIKSIEINNFKIYEYTKINFEDKKLLLLTGPNGYGKTSLIDAIEWCITGDIKRAHENFDLRYTTRPEKNRPENKRGILKNKNCKEDDKVIVRLTFLVNGEEVTIKRERTEDTLECDEEFVVEGNIKSEKAREEVEKLRKEESLYKYNFCDMNKAYKFMNSSRRDIRGQIKDFLTDRTEVENLLKKIDEEIETLSDKIDENKKHIVAQKEIIESKENEKNNIKVSQDIKEYPKIKAYMDEPIIIESPEQAKEVENIIRGWGYSYVYPIVVKLKKSKESVDCKNELLKLKVEYEKERDLIDKFSKSGLNDKERRNEILSRIDKLKEKRKLIKRNFNVNSIEYDPYLVVKKRYEEDKNRYDSIKEEVKLLEKNISTLGRSGKLAEVFTLLVKNKKEIISEYQKKDKKKCPLCGSVERFSSLDENAMAKEAEIYLKEQDIIQKENIEKKVQKNKEAESILNNFKEFCEGWFDSEITKLDKENEILMQEWSKVEKFFSLVNRRKISIKNDINKELTEEINKVSKDILLESEVKELKSEVVKVLEYLNYSKISEIKLDEYTGSVDFLDTLYSKDIAYNEFSYIAMVEKLTYLEVYISSKDIEQIMNKLQIERRKLADFLEKETQLNNEKTKLSLFKIEIGDKIKMLDKIELDDVGPYLYKIFTKIIKHTNITEFNFLRDNSKKEATAGSSFLDKDNNNIMNMFSEGQLGVFMISYFIGNILKRKDKNTLSSFFMDDITNCLDDINVLSFIDTIKYLLKDSNNRMNQLFFATCNENIEALFKNRMEGFEIPYKVIEFTSVGRVKE